MTTTKVQSELIAVNAIHGTIIADDSITSTHLAANSVDSSELVTGSIDTIHIAANQITATKIVTNGVLTRHISDDQITADKLANSINTDIATGPAALPKAGGTMTGALAMNANAITSTGDLTLDVATNIVLDADGGGIYFKDGGTTVGFLQNDGGDFRLVTSASDKDFKILGNDGGSTITALTLDMSAAGAATFNSSVNAANLLISGAQGSDGQVLTSTGSGIAWEDAAGGVAGITSAADATALVIDSAERIGLPVVGHTSPVAPSAPKIAVSGLNPQDAQMVIHRHRAGALAGYLVMQKSRSDTNDKTVVQDGDPLGVISFQGADGSNFQQAAQIEGQVDGTPGTNDMPGRLSFLTTADGANTPTERMRIDNSGDVTMSSTGSLKIPAGTTAQRPTGVNGMIRFNTTLNYIEYYNGAWLDTSSIGIVASGGTTATYSGYKSHTFLASGNFVASTGGTIDIMLVAGGGGGAQDNAGGGGAGGMLVATGVSIVAGTYAIVIGAGGAQAPNGANARGASGANTTGISLTAIGGGGGAGSASSGGYAAFSGGSGGGGGGGTTAGSGTSGQGNAGEQSSGAAGGGGAGEAGGTDGNGYGGDGAANNFRTGSNITYAGGGAGRSGSTGYPGGDGGGGGGSGGAGAANYTGAVNTGGGGAAYSGAWYGAGPGGSGIVVIRYTA